jgi:tetratricopeptide (TPR) repeat protein
MTLRRHFSPVFALPLVAVGATGQAQPEESFGSLVERSLAEINAEKWQEALGTLDQIVERFGADNPLHGFGPQFGAIYYRKGVCEMKLHRWTDAENSFEICYRDFGNPTTGSSNGNVNAFQKRALLKWGEAAMGAGHWELAVSQFRKFLEERDKTLDTFPTGAFYINLAICNYKLGRIPAGNLNLEIAITNKENFPTPDAGIVAGFEALVGTAIATKNEQALLDFIEKNRGEITFEPCEMSVFSSVYMKLGADAFAADMPASALAIYQLVPSSEAVIDDLRARITAMGPLAEMKDASGEVISKKSLQERLDAIGEEYRGHAAAEVIKLAAAAMIHEKHGNPRGAYAAYQQLVAYFPAAARREDYLFNLIRLGISLGESNEVVTENTTKLITEFPNSPSAPAARQLALSSLFQSGKYEQALKVAAASIGTLNEGTPEHDLCLHVLGGSYYYTNQNAKARPLLDEHIAKYPQSPYAQAALYFQASNLAKLRAWDDASPLLDAFIAKFPEAATNPFLSFALYDRAACEFADGEHADALADISRLETEFPASSISETALTLQGNVLAAQEKPDDAKRSYLKALELAEKRRNRGVAAEDLFQLVALLAERSPKESVTFADRFWKSYGGDKSPFRPQVAIAQIRPLNAAKRGEEALTRLRDLIPDLAKTDRGYALENAVSAYANAYLANHDPVALQKHFEAFPGIDPNDQATRALLRIAVISAFEHIVRESPDAAARQAAQAKILALFQELKSSLAPKDLPTPILLKLADHLRSNTSAPREALPYYEIAISRNERTYRFPSLFGRADTYSRSGSPEELQKGIDDFTTIFRESKSRAEREYALFRTIEIRVNKADYPNAIRDAETYLDAKSKFLKFTPEVGLFLARAEQETGDLDAAINAYSKVWSIESAPVRTTAFAIKTWMELLWNRNQPDDRKMAFQSGARYLEATRPLTAKMSAEESALWKEVEKLAATYATAAP